MSPSFPGIDAVAILRKQLTLYRLTRSRYASLSGIGAAKYPGRWNQSGQEAIYTSCEAACAVLELMAHTPKNIIPRDMSMMRILLTGEWGADREALHDTVTGGRIAVLPTVLSAYQYFHSNRFGTERPFAVALPSIISPSLNVVLYPENRGFWEHIKLQGIQTFEFDPRLFPEDALLEDAL